MLQAILIVIGFVAIVFGVKVLLQFLLGCALVAAFVVVSMVALDAFSAWLRGRGL